MTASQGGIYTALLLIILTTVVVGSVTDGDEVYNHGMTLIGENRWDGIGMEKTHCIDTPDSLEMCKDIGYSQMRLPNLLDHSSLPEVVQQFSSWRHLIGRKCSPHTRLFLCSLFTPVCLDRKIFPCRSLCNLVKNSCEDIMRQWGYPWPAMLKCDKFPSQNDLCIDSQHIDAEDNICQPCKEPDTFEGLVDSFCRAGAVFRVTVDSVNAENGYIRVNFMRKKRAYKRGLLVKKDIRKLIGYIPVTNKCDCVKNNASLIAPKKRLLVMGRMEQDKFLLFFVSPYQRKSEGFRAATKMWKKENPCKSWAIPDVYTAEKTEKKEKKKTDKKRNKNDKKNRKKNRKENRKKKRRKKKKDGSKKRNKDRKKSKKGNGVVAPPTQ